MHKMFQIVSRNSYLTNLESEISDPQENRSPEAEVEIFVEIRLLATLADRVTVEQGP